MSYDKARISILVLMVSLGISLPLQGGDDSDDKKLERVSRLWKQLQKADSDSEGYRQAESNLASLLETLDPLAKTEAAALMMKRNAPAWINPFALKDVVGVENIDINAIETMLNNPERSWQERILVRTYYSFLGSEYETVISEARRLEMVAVLGRRVEKAAKIKNVSYGEQRLIHHMLQAAMCRYGGKQKKIEEVQDLYTAMKAYAFSNKSAGDALAPTMKAWLTMSPKIAVEHNSSVAMEALGHWSPVVRQRASAFLGRKLSSGEVLQAILKKLSDPRDEVRAAAARAFCYAPELKSKDIVDKMVELLTTDRGVTVQKAASKALITHSDIDDPARVIDPLIEALAGKPIPGPKRATSILEALGYFSNLETREKMKEKLMNLGVKYLEYAPGGSLSLLKALGGAAKKAIPDIKEYRDKKADRITRKNINSEVLWVIDPASTME